MAEQPPMAPLGEPHDGPEESLAQNSHLESKMPSRRRALSHLLGFVGATVATKWLPDPVQDSADGTMAASSPEALIPLGKATGSFFSPVQKTAISQLADLIIPSDNVAPGASAAKAVDYLDFLLANADKDEQWQWIDGLRLLDELSTRWNGKSFTELAPEQQVALLKEIAGAESRPRTPAEQFFVRLKGSVAEGYYTSRIGLMEDLKYKGNTVNAGAATCKNHFGQDFPPPLAEAPLSGQEAMGERSAAENEAAGRKAIVPPTPGATNLFDRNLKEICAREYDVCIIGSGAAGGIAAKELTEKGLRVVVLERGNWVSPARFKTHVPPWELPFRGRWKSHGENDYTGFLYVKDPVTLPREHIDYCLSPFVGGKTLTWAGCSWRFGPKDFQNRGIGDDWPFGYAELEPYYTRAELFMGVSGSRDGLASTPDGHFLKPLPLRCGEQLINDALVRKMGPAYRVIPLRKALNTEPHGGRPVCHYCGYCMRGCHINALYTSANAALPAAQRTGRLTLVTDAVVREIEVDASGKRCSGAVFIDRQSRQEFRVRARAYALACGGVEDVRIMLMSKSKDYPQGLANTSGWVGKNLISEHYDAATGVGYLERLLGAEVLNEDGAQHHGEIQNVYYDNPSKNFARGYMIDLWCGPIQTPSFAADVPGFGAKYREEVRRIYPAMVYLDAHGEMLTNDKTYVDLDPEARDELGLPKARMHLEWGENELAMVRDEREKLQAIIEAAGGKVLGFRDQPLKPGFDGENLVGTVRMGDDPKRSVLNRYNRAHDLRNLWVLDGASFTSYCEKNPTLTVIAVAIRACGHLVEAVRKMEA